MATLTSTLVVRLLDQVSGPAAIASRALLGIGTAAAAASGRGIVGLGGNLTRMAEGARNAQRHLTAAGNTMRGMTFPVLLGGGFAARSVFEFEKVGNTIEAVTNITKAQREELENFANVLSPLRGFSSTEILKSALELGRAGLSFDQIMGALKGTLNLARAGNIELQESSDIATNVLTAMRLPMTTTEQIARSLTRVNDVLAFGANQSNADVRQLGDTFKFVGPMAAAAGLSIEHTAAAAMVMANNGIKGSEAGVALRSALVRMVRPTSFMQQALSRMNIDIREFVKGGRQISASDIVASLATSGIDARPFTAQIDRVLKDPKLKRSLTGMTRELVGIIAADGGAMDKDKLAAVINDSLTAAGSEVDLFGFIRALQESGADLGDIARIFDSRQGARLITLLAGFKNLGVFLRRLETEARGSTDRAADIMMQGVVGAWARFTASITRLLQAIASSGVLESATNALNGLASSINALAKTNPALLEFGTYALLIAAVVGPLAAAAGSIAGIVSLLLLLGGKGVLKGAAAATGIGAGTAGTAAAGAGAGAAAARGILGRLGIAGAASAGAWWAGGKLGRALDNWLFAHGIDTFAITGGTPPTPQTLDAINADTARFRERLDRIKANMHQPKLGITDRQGNPIIGSGGPSVPSVAGKVGAQSGEMADAGHVLGSAMMRGIETEIRAKLPGIVGEMARQLSSITVSPTITPRVDSSALRGVHGDVGVDVTR